MAREQIDLSELAPLGGFLEDVPTEPVVGDDAAAGDEEPPEAAPPAQQPAGARPAGGEGVQPLMPPQIELGEIVAFPDAPRRKYERYSVAHMERMRDGARIAKANAKAAAAQAGFKQASGTLKMACTLLPGVGKLVNSGPTSHLGRKRDPQPDDFVLVVRAMHLPKNTPVQLGIRFERLQAAGAALISLKQQNGLSTILGSLSEAMASGTARRAHTSFTHLWDEVEVKFQWGAKSLRATRKATLMQILVQRGVVGFSAGASGSGSVVSFGEHWITPPLEVGGTSAGALKAGLLRGVPQEFNFSDTEALKKATRNGCTFTYMPMCDKASGNLSLMKAWGATWEKISNDSALVGKIFFWPEVCMVHTHHRAKLQVKGLRAHTMRHFSVANLMRLKGVQSRVLGRLESLVSERLHRIVQPPPPPPAARRRLGRLAPRRRYSV